MRYNRPLVSEGSRMMALNVPMRNYEKDSLETKPETVREVASNAMDGSERPFIRDKIPDTQISKFYRRYPNWDKKHMGTDYGAVER